MNNLTSRELLDTGRTSAATRAHAPGDFFRPPAPHRAASSQKVFGGFVAVAIQALFLIGIGYGTMRGVAPQTENLMVVNVLDEAPVVEDLPPPPPVKLEQPVIHMQAPLVTITQAEPPPPTAPTAIVSAAPQPVAVYYDDGERQRQIVDFQRALQRHLIRQMRYPAAARARKEEGIVYVRVAMDRRGNVISAKIQEASGFVELNAEGLAVIQRAQPLPIPPDVVQGDPVDLIVPVTFSLRMGRGGRGRARDN
jgi:TonB family protein